MLSMQSKLAPYNRLLSGADLGWYTEKLLGNEWRRIIVTEKRRWHPWGVQLMPIIDDNEVEMLTELWRLTDEGQCYVKLPVRLISYLHSCDSVIIREDENPPGISSTIQWFSFSNLLENYFLRAFCLNAFWRNSQRLSLSLLFHRSNLQVRLFGNEWARCNNQKIYIDDRRHPTYPGAKIKISNLIQGFVILGINGSWLSSKPRDNYIRNVHKSVPVPF